MLTTKRKNEEEEERGGEDTINMKKKIYEIYTQLYIVVLNCFLFVLLILEFKIIDEENEEEEIEVVFKLN